METEISDDICSNSDQTNEKESKKEEPIEAKKPNSQFDERVEDELICSICQDLLYKPVTLYCQHNYCYQCIKNVKKNKADNCLKCPLCKCAFVVPKKHNVLLENVIQILFPNKQSERKLEVKKDKIYKNLKQEVREQLRHDLYEEILAEVSRSARNKNLGRKGREYVTPENRARIAYDSQLIPVRGVEVSLYTDIALPGDDIEQLVEDTTVISDDLSENLAHDSSSPENDEIHYVSDQNSYTEDNLDNSDNLDNLDNSDNLDNLDNSDDLDINSVDDFDNLDDDSVNSTRTEYIGERLYPVQGEYYVPERVRRFPYFNMSRSPPFGIISGQEYTYEAESTHIRFTSKTSLKNKKYRKIDLEVPLEAEHTIATLNKNDLPIIKNFFNLIDHGTPNFMFEFCQIIILISGFCVLLNLIDAGFERERSMFDIMHYLFNLIFTVVLAASWCIVEMLYHTYIDNQKRSMALVIKNI